MEKADEESDGAVEVGESGGGTAAFRVLGSIGHVPSLSQPDIVSTESSNYHKREHD